MQSVRSSYRHSIGMLKQIPPSQEQNQQHLLFHSNLATQESQGDARTNQTLQPPLTARDPTNQFEGLKIIAESQRISIDANQTPQHSSNYFNTSKPSAVESKSTTV